MAEDHFSRLRRLLELESDAEAARILERSRRLTPAEAEESGNSLVDLVIADEDAGLGGRYLVRLVKRRRSPLPWTRLDVGSPVILSPGAKTTGGGYRGVISERRPDQVQVALSSMPDDLEDHATWRLDLAFDEIAMHRQRAALQQAAMAAGNRTAALRAILLGEKPPSFSPFRALPTLDENLNATQRDAVRLAVSARDLALIHGPPGTGKTTTIVEVIRHAIRAGQKVLACAPSNMGVDNLFQRLLACDELAVRLGHPARVLPELRAHTLDLMVEEHPDVKVARRLVKDAVAMFRKADHHRRSKPQRGEKRGIREEARSLLADARRLEAQAVRHILDTADVLCATTTGLDAELLGNRRFDLVVIDEACQSTEPGCWIPILRAERIVLAGDHRQLPPTILSPQAAEEGFGVSLFERIVAMYGETVSRRLEVQYRMHAQIMEFSSREFYDDTLVAHESVVSHRLCDLPDVQSTPLTERVIDFIDTAGAGYDEELEPDGDSKLNPQEAELVRSEVLALLASGVRPQDIAVIAPYSAQGKLLRNLIQVPGLEIDSVDGFQGREKEAVVISLVRSNARGEIGFLSDVRRMNVALTRARRTLIVIGDSATLSSAPFFARMITYFEEIGAYQTVWDRLPLE
ncbi:MAG: AAA domain-containing protein [Planctomycetia bacterium]|nr:AAA domain-containing protein [Planctomycetia bacterium]